MKSWMKNEDIPSMTIATKIQTTVGMDIPAKTCTSAMETWMPLFQEVVMVTMSRSGECQAIS